MTDAGLSLSRKVLRSPVTVMSGLGCDWLAARPHSFLRAGIPTWMPDRHRWVGNEKLANRQNRVTGQGESDGAARLVAGRRAAFVFLRTSV